ncbi:MAG: DUF3107 domain-containing protein [Dermatophilaceae bacterium]
MEIRIGVQHCTREITLDSDQSPEEIEAAVSAAIDAGTTLRLLDSKGEVALVPSRAIGYIEIGAPRHGGVGFGRL